MVLTESKGLSGLSIHKNCLSCSHYIGCKDNLRSVIYRCERFNVTTASQVDGVNRLFDSLEMSVPVRESSLIATPENNESEFNLAKTIRKAIESDRIVSPDIRVDDSDFPTAPNFYTFCVKDHFLKQKPYIWQSMVGSIVMSEVCPRCSDMDYVDGGWKPRDSRDTFERKVCLLEHGICPHCKAPKSKLVLRNKLNFYNECAAVLGQRSGKSAWLGDMTAYLTHLLLKLQNANEVYGLKSSNVLHGTFVALTYAQARDTLWEPYYGNLLDSPWFQDYHAHLDHLGRKFGNEVLYNLKDTFVKYNHRRLFVYPAGPDKRVLRGRTRAFACLSEDTLVSTSLGLVEIKNDLYDVFTHVGSNHFKISDWLPTGFKDTYKVELKTGQYVECTGNHEIKTRRGWVRTDSLHKNDLVAVSLGGKFPRKLTLDFSARYEPAFAKIYREIERLKTFELDDLRGLGRSVTPITSDLRRKGHIERHYYKGRTGADGLCRCYYKVCSGFDVELLISQASSYTGGQVSFPSEMTVELASLLGYYVADGSYSENCSEILFATSVGRRARHFLRCFKTVFKTSPRKSFYLTETGTRMTRYSVAYQIIKDFFRHIGLTGATSKTKEIPWSILQAPKECAAAFLAAAYDCDGGIRNCNIVYYTVSEKLASHVQMLLQRFGIFSRKSIKTRLLKEDPLELQKNPVLCVEIVEPCYHTLFKNHIGFSTNPLIIRTRGNYSPFTPDENGIVWVPVVRRKYSGKRQVYDITVDDLDHGFTAGGIVVHNSIDELGWFPNDIDAAKNIKMNADEVYTALANSLMTVRGAAASLIERGFNNIPNAYFLNISSPRSIRDKIMELVKKSESSREIFGIVKPTWEANPLLPRKALAEHFKRDPVAAMRDFGAQPPLTNSPFFSDEAALENCFSGKKNRIKIVYDRVESGRGKFTRYAYIDKMQPKGNASIMSLDAGLVNNSFACTIGHLDGKAPIISLMVEIMPAPGVPLNFTYIYNELLSEIITDRNVVLIVADRWNSIKLLQDASDEFGIEHRQYSLKYADMLLFKDYMLDQQVQFPSPTESIEDILKYDQSKYPDCFKHKPIDHFVLQALTVQDSGSTVIKGDQLTDDLFRSTALCFRQLIDEQNAELLNQADAEVRPVFDITKSAIVKSYGAAAGVSSVKSGTTSNGSSLGSVRQRKS